MSDELSGELRTERVSGLPTQPVSALLSAQDQMQILYEIAVSIGVALDTRVMLSTAIDAFLRQLNCVAGAIYLSHSDDDRRQPACAKPRNQNINTAVKIVDSLLPEKVERAEWDAFLTHLPRQGQSDADTWYHLLRLGNLGFLVLVRKGTPIAGDLLEMLSPLLVKLTESGRACLQNEELAAAHHRMLWEHNMLHTLIDATPSVLLSLDEEGRYLLAEGRGLALLGREPKDAVGKSVFDIHADVPGVTDNVRAALAGETRAVTFETGGRTFDAVYRPVIDTNHRIHGVVGAAYDVTERTVAIDTLTAVLNTVDEGIITTDAGGTILMANAQIGEMFGFTGDELLGQPFWTLLDPAHRPDSTTTTMKAFVDARQPQNPQFFLELEGRTRSGRTFPIEIRIQSFVLANQETFTISIRDVTERREYDRLRDDFVSAVSHELRTPLASIMGWTETLLTGHPGPLNDLQRRFLDTVYASSVRLDKLIEELLTVSRIQRGTLRLNSAPFSPSQLLANAQTELAVQLNSRKIRLVVQDSWPQENELDGDGERIEQVIKQLLINAIKFSPVGGEVIVRSRMLSDHWQFEVEDHGMGVSPEEIPLIFQRFYRGTAARRAQIQGTGLGLYVAKAVVEGHGGEISLSSQPGMETVVRFHIPGRREQA